MKLVAIDSKSHQAIRHWGTEDSIYELTSNVGAWRGERLIGLENDLKERNFRLSQVTITKESLQGVSVLVISGRSDHLPFSGEELTAIESFWEEGGGLYLMASHQGFVEPQNQVAQALQLPVTFHDDWITKLAPQLNSESSHMILKGCGRGSKIRTSCKMVLQSKEAVSLVSDKCPEIGVIMAAITHSDALKGRAVVSTSSGHIASRDDSGADLYSAASNTTLTLGIIEWLANGNGKNI